MHNLQNLLRYFDTKLNNRYFRFLIVIAIGSRFSNENVMSKLCHCLDKKGEKIKVDLSYTCYHSNVSSYVE